MRFQYSHKRHSELDMTPLVSVIFLLIIFFLVAGTIRSPGFWDIEHPESSSEHRIERMDLSLFLDQDGNMAVGERPIRNNFQLRYLMDQSHQDGVPPSVEVHADQRVDAHQLVKLLEEIRKSGVKEIELVTTEAQR